jgi:hypothetical protein
VWNADIRCSASPWLCVCIQLFTLEHCWSSSTASCFNTHLTALISLYHLFTYPKNWLRSQHFNNNEDLMQGVKTWLSSQVADFFDTDIQELILCMCFLQKLCYKHEHFPGCLSCCV